jgi:anaerobic magnesium-protoporphyrin IX monomethyl ester cyclase
VKAVLIFPPPADPALPYASLPYLAAALQKHGFHDVIQKDLNLETFLHLLTEPQLRNAADATEKTLRRNGLPDDRAENLRHILREATCTANDLPEALAILKDPVRFYEPDSLLFAKQVFNDACDLLSAPFEHFSFKKYSYSTHQLLSPHEISSAIDEEPDNPVIRFFREKAVPEIVSLNPRFVAISIPYFQQLVPSLILTKLIKQQIPSTFVCLGGPIVSWGKQALLEESFQHLAIDGFFVGEADTALPKLLEELSGSRRFERVPNFVLLQGGKVRDFSDPPYSEDLDSLPTPAYEGLPLSDYLAPRRVISLSLSRGCYWNRCTFCNYSFIKLAPYRFRDPASSVRDVAAIVEKTGEDVFCFESDVIHPDDLAAFSRELIAQDVRIKWHAVMRFEESIDDEFCNLLADAGCVRLYAGLESACQRLLDLMDKGTSVPVVDRILRSCHNAGIAVEAGVFFGFPTETTEEAQQTVEFFRTHRNEITRSDAGTFRLLRGSPMSAEPREYGIVVTDVYEERWFELSYHPMEDTGRNHSKKAVAELENLYPAIKFIDIPEEILLLAELGPKGLDKILPSSIGRTAPEERSLRSD